VGIRKLLALTAIAAVFGQSNVQADRIVIEIENAQPDPGGFYFTPVFLGFHDGSFDVFDGGAMASNALETLAETGATGDLASNLMSFQASSQSTTLFGDTTGPPPFDPGEVNSTTVDVDVANQRFLNFASMVIPSNDAFFGNDAALELFDASGAFIGPQTIEITAGMIYDAGTEVNDIDGGAAFSANGGTSADEDNPIALINLDDLNDFIGSETAAGTFITEALTADSVVARINISAVPEPGSMAVLGLVGLAGLIRRKRS
jgi:hypothetical protein